MRNWLLITVTPRLRKRIGTERLTCAKCNRKLQDNTKAWSHGGAGSGKTTTRYYCTKCYKQLYT